MDTGITKKITQKDTAVLVNNNFTDYNIFTGIVAELGNERELNSEHIELAYSELSNITAAILACTPSILLKSLYEELGLGECCNIKLAKRVANKWINDNHPRTNSIKFDDAYRRAFGANFKSLVAGRQKVIYEKMIVNALLKKIITTAQADEMWAAYFDNMDQLDRSFE